MKSVEGLMQNLKLSVAEKKQIEVGGMKKTEGSVNKVIGKLLSERLAHPKAIERALGKVWCPFSGIDCKALGDNKFIFMFHQASGKRRALEERPWVFSNELLVMMDLDEEKSIDEMEFFFVPIWIRVSNLPIGLMNKEVGEAIGNEAGEFLEAEEDDGGVPLGKFMRIKIKLDICKPLMRGVMMWMGKEGKEKWCPIAYEYLPDFCYVCGVIGHIDKVCHIKLGKGEKQPFDKGLRCIPSRNMGDVDSRGRRQTRPRLPIAQMGSGMSKMTGVGGSKGGLSLSRSDVTSWRKNGDGREAHEQCHAEGASEIAVTQEAMVAVEKFKEDPLTKQSLEGGDGSMGMLISKSGDERISGQQSPLGEVVQDSMQLATETERKGKGKVRTFKRVQRKENNSEMVQEALGVRGKRGREEAAMEIDLEVEKGKKIKK